MRSTWYFSIRIVTGNGQSEIKRIQATELYAAFGKVIEGQDIVNKIATTQTDYSDRPLKKQIMKKVTVDTFGVDYEEPEKC